MQQMLVITETLEQHLLSKFTRIPLRYSSKYAQTLENLTLKIFIFTIALRDTKNYSEMIWASQERAM